MAGLPCYPTLAAIPKPVDVVAVAVPAAQAALRNERRSGELCAATADHAEGLRAVVEKRPVAFRGR